MRTIQEIKIRAVNGIGLTAEETIQLCDAVWEMAVAESRLQEEQETLLRAYYRG